MLCVLVAAAFLVWALLAESPHFAFPAAVPAAIGVALAVTRQRPFTADVTETGLEIHDLALVLPYHAIEGLTAHGRVRRATAMRLYHAGGVVRIPARLSVSSRELYTFIKERLPESGSRDVTATLVPYLRQQEQVFGQDKVFAYRPRPGGGGRARPRSAAVCMAIAVAGLVWVVAGAVGGKDYAPWIACGVILAFLFGLFALALFLDVGTHRIKNVRSSGLVIGPAGLALVQGDMRGELRWDELRKVQYRDRPRSFQFEYQRPLLGIELVVEGATIVIADIFDRPLPMIHDRIVAYWRGGDDAEE